MMDLLKQHAWGIIIAALSGAASFGAYKTALATVEQNVSTHTEQIRELQINEATDHQLLLDMKDNVTEIHDDVKALLRERQSHPSVLAQRERDCLMLCDATARRQSEG